MKRPARKQMDVQITCLLLLLRHLPKVRPSLGRTFYELTFKMTKLEVINGQNWALKVFVLKTICDKLGMAKDN